MKTKRGEPWLEPEIKDAIRAYFRLLAANDDGKNVNKAAVYRDLSAKNPARSVKSFERKFQNISAILYEEKHPFVDGLLPNSNYQRLLKLMVLDHLGRTEEPTRSPLQILVGKLRSMHRTSSLVPVQGKGAGRFGLTLEHYLGIPPNSDKNPDFMGIELKTKLGNTLQTLFSRVPSRYIGCADKGELLRRYGYFDAKRQRQALYTSFSSNPDSLGFALSVRSETIVVFRNGEDLLAYDYDVLEDALLSKHSETAYLSVVVGKLKNGADGCRFENLMYCSKSSVLRFLQLVRAGKIFLNFTLSETNEKVKDHGFLWRIQSSSLPELYLKTEHINIDSQLTKHEAAGAEKKSKKRKQQGRKRASQQ